MGELVAKPGHEKVRSLLYKVLTGGLGAKSTDIDFEKQLPEVRGRIDALLGRTVFEIKSDLARERMDAESQLLRYLPQREAETHQRFVGVATDGAEFGVYVVRSGSLEKISSYRPKISEPRVFLAWLESVVVLNDELLPDIQSVKRELGRDSVHYRRAVTEIEQIWDRVKNRPEANLKRDLWNRLLRVAYGTDIGAPALFFQHTYLTIIAKSIATVALNDVLPTSAADLLDGSAFRDLGIVGAVEGDFFDWILDDDRGRALVIEIARHANRFRLHDIQVDILKGLYESLIDPEQRHDLGEYYTPDWLAERICASTINEPLKLRIIDPACGSGTFLFHAIRRLIVAADSAGLPAEAAINLACEKVAGIDIHPVAVIFSRVTYLLALAPKLSIGRPATISVPVYLGDALQWNARELFNIRDLEIVVPAEGESAGKFPGEGDEKRVVLRFPEKIAAEPPVFDATLNIILDLASRGRPVADLVAWLASKGIDARADVEMISKTYEALCALQKEGRNHIWGYVARNLSRPIWLATDQQKADIVIGNPPWLDYRAMNPKTQERFHEEMKSVGLWRGKVHGAAFDLSAYFFARCVRLYMKTTGKIAFVMPNAAMTRSSYQAFLSGNFKTPDSRDIYVKFTEAWVFPSEVSPLFPVPSCVLFAERTDQTSALPKTATFFAGELPRRDATAREATAALSKKIRPWPTTGSEKPSSEYRKKFRAGAKLDPRRLVLVTRIPSARLGPNPAAPIVRGRIGSLDKKPWNRVEPPQTAVESKFLHPVYLGESIGPFRLFDPVTAVIPWDEERKNLMTASVAGQRGFARLANWLERVEALWEQHGKGKTTFAEKINFYHLLSVQFPIAPRRVVYSKSGTLPAAAVLKAEDALVDHKLYWIAVTSDDEAYYLAAVLNSETARSAAEKWQSEGQWGKRDFDKAPLKLPIPLFDGGIELHRRIAALGRRAEKIASLVEFKEREYFTRRRKRIRESLEHEGVASDIDEFVGALLKEKGRRSANPD